MLNISLVFIKVLIGQKGIDMMAMLFATKVILGTITFSDVPRLLKEKVKTILIENGLEELAKETE